jgi:hypothetical protein
MTMTERTLISTDIDFSRDGKQVSVLRLPHSSNASAYGVIAIPIAVIKNGDGPTVMLMAANHGDEYEGPVTLGKLIRELEPAMIRGRLILLPAANFPAATAGLRNSPIDGLNLNRCFPGNPDGSPTQQIAHYIAKFLMPMADALLDLHSGGATLDFIPCVNIYRHDGALRDRTLALARNFGAPLTILFDDRGEERTILATARRLGLPAMTTEMGGGATLSIPGLRLCMAGMRRVLAHLEVMPFAGSEATPSATRLVEISNQGSYVYAPMSGLFESFHNLGATVEMDQLAGSIHFLDDPARPPVEVRYPGSGLLCMTRPPAQVVRGDCLALVVTDAVV